MPISKHDHKIPLGFAQHQTCGEGPLHPQALEGLRLFNRGAYFQAHEALENAWRAEPGTIRDLYRGVLQVAVMYHHIQNQNFRGAVKMYERCMQWLDPFPDICNGIAIAELRENCRAVHQQLSLLGPNGMARFDLAFLRPIGYIPVDRTDGAE